MIRQAKILKYDKNELKEEYKNTALLSIVRFSFWEQINCAATLREQQDLYCQKKEMVFKKKRERDGISESSLDWVDLDELCNLSVPHNGGVIM